MGFLGSSLRRHPLCKAGVSEAHCYCLISRVGHQLFPQGRPQKAISCSLRAVPRKQSSASCEELRPPSGLPSSRPSLGRTNPGTAAAPRTPCPPDPSLSLQPPFGHSLILLCPSYIAAPNPERSAPGEAAPGRAERTDPSQHPRAVLGLMPPRALLALWAARACCWLTFNLLSDPSLWCCSPAPHPQVFT